MRFRKLRIAWSVLWAIAAVLLVALWVRSYWRIDMATYIHSIKMVFHPSSLRGRIMLMVTPMTIIDGAGIQTYSITQATGIDQLPDAFLGFYFCHRPNSTIAILPYWFVVLCTGILTAVPWIRWSNRFSLRTLLIAMTLVAVLLGLAVYAASK
jgi:hypothetical protein